MSNDDEAVFVDFVNRARRAQVAVNEVIERSLSEPEADEEESDNIREQFLNDHYWLTRSHLDDMVDADNDDDYRHALAQLRTAIEKYPT